MKQADLGLDLTSRKARKGMFLDEMDRVVPWAQLSAIASAPHCSFSEPSAPKAGEAQLAWSNSVERSIADIKRRVDVEGRCWRRIP